jgi:hypothetical protein
MLIYTYISLSKNAVSRTGTRTHLGNIFITESIGMVSIIEDDHFKESATRIILAMELCTLKWTNLLANFVVQYIGRLELPVIGCLAMSTPSLPLQL